MRNLRGHNSIVGLGTLLDHALECVPSRFRGRSRWPPWLDKVDHSVTDLLSPIRVTLSSWCFPAVLQRSQNNGFGECGRGWWSLFTIRIARLPCFVAPGQCVWVGWQAQAFIRCGSLSRPLGDLPYDDVLPSCAETSQPPDIYNAQISNQFTRPLPSTR